MTIIGLPTFPEEIAMPRTPLKSCLTALIAVVALASLAASWASSSSPTEAEAGTMYNCPQAGKWAISVWSGERTATAEALDTCGAGAVDAAYYIHPLTQTWRVFFRGQPAISDLNGLDDLQAVATLGSPTASSYVERSAHAYSWSQPRSNERLSPGRQVGAIVVERPQRNRDRGRLRNL